MEQKRYAAALRWAAPGSAAALALLRVTVLKTAFEENGLLPVGSKALLLTVIAAAAFFAGLWFLSTRLNRLPGTEACFSSKPGWLFLKLTAAGLVFLGAFFTLTGGQEAESAERTAALFGAAAAVLMAFTALKLERGVPFFWVRLVPALYTGASLILRFRSWSHDPLVIHLVPVLLAWTCCMVEMMLLTGFPLKAGHRRSGVLFGLAAGIFACMTIPDYVLGLRTNLPELLTLLGLSVWCAAAALELLREQVQTEQAPTPAEAPSEPEAGPEAEPETEPEQPQ
jgi:hypothetical protein